MASDAVVGVSRATLEIIKARAAEGCRMCEMTLRSIDQSDILRDYPIRVDKHRNELAMSLFPEKAKAGERFRKGSDEDVQYPVEAQRTHINWEKGCWEARKASHSIAK